MSALSQDVLADGPLREQGVASHEPSREVDLPKQGHSLGQLVLASTDGHLREHRPAVAGISTQ